MDIYSWNVNGIRAVYNKGELDNFINTYDPDIICIQETKAQPNQIEELNLYENYYKYINSAEKKGYSGVMVFTKTEPKSVHILDADNEGRFIALEYNNFTLINCYFPNSQKEGARLDFKLEFNGLVLDFINSIKGNVILCGDFNVAHEEIDLKNPKTNTKNPGFLPEERQWFSKLMKNNYIDTFRYLHPDIQKFSWWSYRFKARERDIGWRIDYFVVNKDFAQSIKSADIITQANGSDHCPVYIKVEH